MRILHIAHRLYPPCRGGLSTYVANVARLHATAHNVEVWTTLEDQRERISWENGYLVRRFPPSFAFLENPTSPKMLSYALCSNNLPDVIVAHSQLVLTSNIACLMSKTYGKPLVLVSHGFSVDRGSTFNFLEGLYLNTVSRAIVAQARRVIALTRYQARLLERIGVTPKKCSIVPPGVDCHYFKPSHTPYHGRTILWTGRFVPEKNLPFLLKVFARMKHSTPSLRLILAGGGPEERLVRETIASLKLRDSVKLAGMLSSLQLLRLLRKSTVYCLPSKTDALPLALLESMAAGVPAVVSQGIGLDELVEGAGLLAKVDDTEDWVSKLESILENPAFRNQMSSGARRLAVEQYDWPAVATRLEEVFQRAI